MEFEEWLLTMFTPGELAEESDPDFLNRMYLVYCEEYSIDDSRLWQAM